LDRGNAYSPEPPFLTTVIAAITKAAVAINMMRLMSVTSSFCSVLSNPLVGPLVLYEGDDGHALCRAHRKNYLIPALWGT
jgi:hypothetical protein